MAFRRPRLQQWPQLGTYTLAAGDEIDLPLGGSFFRMKEASGELDVQLDDDAPMTIQANFKTRLSDGDTYKRIVISNKGASAVSFQIQYGSGDIDTSETTLSGTVNVQNPVGEELDVKNTDLETLLQTLASVKKPYSDIQAATIYSNSGVLAAEEIISAAANVNGIYIHRIELTGGSKEAFIDIGTDRLLNTRGYYNANTSFDNQGILENYLLPAGEALTVTTDNASAAIVVIYELV